MKAYLDDLRAQVGPFERGGWYSTEGDTLYFFNESADQYRQRVDDMLTVYRAEEDHRIIGVEIKCVSKLPKHDAAGVIVVQTGRYSVVALLLATLENQVAPNEIERGDPNRVRPYFDAILAFSPQVAAGRDLVEV